MKCPNCEHDNPVNQQYCTRCGLRIDVDFAAMMQSVSSDELERRFERRRFGLAVAIMLASVLFAGVWGLEFILAPELRIPHLPLPAAAPPDIEVAAAEAPGMPPIPGEMWSDLPVPERQPRLAQRLGFRRDPMRRAIHADRGGDPAALEAVRKGLESLCGRQDRGTGMWLAGNRAWGMPGVTGLAVLALLGNGHVWTDPKDRLGEAAGRGVRYLLSIQDESGRVGADTGNYMYNHGIATAALCEAYAMSGVEALRGPAEAALRYLASAQQESGGWDYTIRKGRRSDISVTAWQVAAIYSARLAGLDVPAGVSASAAAFVDKLTDRNTAETEYEYGRTSGQKPPTLSPTAIALACRAALGQSGSSPMMRRQAAILLRPENLPAWKAEWSRNPPREQFNLYYYWYHGTVGMRLVGGEQWKTWLAATTKALMDSQANDGSWPVAGFWATEGGPAYATAMAVLALEATYRYP